MKNKFTATCSKCGKPVLAGAGETNMHAGKWVTEHVGEEACKSAAAGAVRSRPHFSGSFYGSAAWLGSDYDDDDYNGCYGDTSEDVNPNEGSK